LAQNIGSQTFPVVITILCKVLGGFKLQYLNYINIPGPGLPPDILVSTDEDRLTVSWSPSDEYTSIDIAVSGERYRGTIGRKIKVSLQ